MELGQSLIHRVVDRIRQQETPSGIHTEFTWKAEPKTWGGFTQKDLISLVDEIADFYRILPQDRRKIHIHFGDHEPFKTKDEPDILATAVHIPIYKNSSLINPIERCEIMLNRSLELSQSQSGLDTTYKLGDRQGYIIDEKQKIIGCLLRHPWEGVVWMLAEELNHAAVALKLRDDFRHFQIKRKYGRYARKFHEHGTQIDDYTQNIVEIAAHRQLLRFLEKMARKKRLPDRAALFRELYQLSLEKRMPVLLMDKEIASSLYIPTGYRPPS